MTPHSSPTASDTTDAGGHPRRWMILLALTGSLSMIFVDVTVSGVAGPTIAGEFGSGTDGVAWIANAYLVALAAWASAPPTPTSPELAVWAALFGITVTVWCSFSPSVGFLTGP